MTSHRLTPSPPRPPLTLSAMCTTALAVFSSHVFPDTTNRLAFPLTLALIAVFGVPHGAADHLVHAWRHRPLGRDGGGPAFFGGYIGLVVAHALLWYLSPPCAFALFMCMAVWHFGQGEYEYLGGRNPIEYYAARHTRMVPWVLYVSRGLVVISLLTFAQPHLTFPVIQAVTALNPAVIPSPALPATQKACHAIVAGAIAQHVALLMYIHSHSSFLASTFMHDHVPKFAALVLLFTQVNVYLAFGIYFGLWHALEFFLSVQSSLALPTRSMVARAVIPLSLPVLGAMVIMGMYWAHGVGERVVLASELAYWRAFLVVVSSVTTPHVVYLHGYVQVRMCRKEDGVVAAEEQWQVMGNKVKSGYGKGEQIEKVVRVIKSAAVAKSTRDERQERKNLNAGKAVACERHVVSAGQPIAMSRR